MKTAIPASIRRWRRERAEWAQFLLFIAPNMLLLMVFTYWPIFRSVWLSFTGARLHGQDAPFLGLANYARLLHDAEAWQAVLNTLIYAGLVVVIAQPLALGLALLLNKPRPGRTLLRTLAFLPHVTTPAAAAIVWILLLDPRLGPFSHLYDWLGVQGPSLLRSPSLSLLAVAIVGMWKEIAFATLFFLAGLQFLPIESYEAAALETESKSEVFFHITLPLLAPVVFFLAVSGFIASTKVFDLVYVMTRGGPIYPDSSTYVYHLYELAFRRFELGYASAFATVFFVLTLGMTLLQFWLAARWAQTRSGS